MQYPAYIGNILERLELSGEEAYLVGGSLRDSLLGIAPHDFDITTSALPERTREIFSDFRVLDIGLKHGTVTVMTEGGPVEITTFRVDGAYTDARHPDSVCFTDRIEEDLSRRDFTVNAMAYHPHKGLVDPFGGREDLKRKRIRAVGDPGLRFSEDALRIMRAFRFSAQLGFSVEEETLAGAAAMREGLSRIAAERICSEFIRLLTSAEPAGAIRRMRQTGVLPYVTGAYAPSEETVGLIAKMPATDVARLGMYFAEAEPAVIDGTLHDLKCSAKQIRGAVAIARGAGMPLETPADAARLIAGTGVYAEDAARAAVLLGRAPEEAVRFVSENRRPTRIADLAVNGRDLAQIGISGRETGRILSVLLDQTMNEPEQNRKEILLRLAKEKSEKTSGGREKPKQ